MNLNSALRKKIVIVEDNEDLRNSYSLIINNSGSYEVIGAYGTGEEAIEKVQKRVPDIILMDIELPGINGSETTRRILERNHLIQIVMLTVHEGDNLVFEALQAGASGYITKGAPYVEIIEALNEIVKGGAPMSSSIARMVINHFHADPNPPLTKREMQVLKLMSKGLTYTQIANELIITKETSKTHIRNIYEKLNVSSKSEALEKAVKDRIIV